MMKKLINFYKRLTFLQGMALAISLSSIIAIATVVPPLQTFNPGTVISSSQVNSNFTILKTAIESTSSQVYMGTWSAAGGTSPSATTAGEYWVITVPGTISAVSYVAGDWIIFNGTTFDKIPSTSAITTVFGRTGAIAAVEGDYNLNKMSDVDLTTTPPVTNDFLKFNGTQWVPAVPSLAESDPSVLGFAKSALPTCSGGQAAFTNGSNFSCVSMPAPFSGTASRAVVTDGTGNLVTASATNIEINYLAGVTSSIQTQLSGKEALVSAGTMSEYWRGDKTWQNLATATINSQLTGLSSVGGPITSSDTIISGFNKAAYIQGDYVSKSGSTTVSGTITISGAGGLIVPTPISMNDAVNKSYADSLLVNLSLTPSLTKVGQGAGNITSGTGGTFIGRDAGYNLSSASNNTFVGHESGKLLSSGSSNTAIGTGALYSSGSRNSNTAVGYYALRNLTSGSDNIAIGYEAGSTLTTGSGNVIIGGYDMSTSSPAINDTIVFATGSGLHRMRITDTGNVGIGTTTPNNYAILDLNTTGTNSALLVPRSTTALRPSAPADGMIRYNTTTLLMEFYENGGWRNYTTISDGRLKTNLAPVNEGLMIVNKLQPVFFDWDQNSERAKSFGSRHQVGFIAQQVEKVLPEVVNIGRDGFRSLEYGKMVAVVVAAIQDLSKSFDSNDQEINAIKAENKMLKSYLCHKDPEAPFCE